MGLGFYPNIAIFSLSIPALFSRTAVICTTLGFITLLCMVIVAVYKTNQPKQLKKGSNGTGQGNVIYIYIYIYIYALMSL